MGKKTLGEIVKQSVTISAFIGIAIVLAGNITGNRHWYHGTYGTRKVGIIANYYQGKESPNLESMSYAALKRRYERAVQRELDRKSESI